MANILLGKWKMVDFEQVLVTNVNAVEAGARVDTLPDARKRALWFTDEFLFMDLLAPFSDLLLALGYDSDSGHSSFSGFVSRMRKHMQFARQHKALAADVNAAVVEAMHQAIAEASEGWVQYFLSTSPAAPFPFSFISEDSDVYSHVSRKIKVARKAVDLQAEVPRFLEALTAKSPPPKDPSPSVVKISKAEPPSGALPYSVGRLSAHLQLFDSFWGLWL